MALLYITKIFPKRQQFSKYHPQKQKLQLGKQSQHNANQIDPAYPSLIQNPDPLWIWLFTPSAGPFWKVSSCKVAMMMIHRNSDCLGAPQNTEWWPWQCPVDLPKKPGTCFSIDTPVCCLDSGLFPWSESAFPGGTPLAVSSVRSFWLSLQPKPLYITLFPPSFNEIRLDQWLRVV